jgi:glycosyltransferase involved in cell wall biosynthesis
MQQPLVSVIIPNYNYAGYLREAVDSVLAQTYPNIEVIVVDDGSKDNSKEAIESYGNRIKAIFQQNAGVSAARNNGVAASRGEYIAFLDADDVWYSRKIAEQMRAFSDDKDLGLVHVAVEDIDADGGFLREHRDGQKGMVASEFLLFRRPVVLGGGSGIVIPRRVFEEVGGFDKKLSTSADWDLFFRISCRYTVGFVPEVLLKYRLHNSNMHGNIARMEKEMLYGYEKAFPKNGGEHSPIKNECYGNLHQVLAGSYFNAGNYAQFFRHTIKSLWLTPCNFLYFAKFPARRLRRKTG